MQGVQARQRGLVKVPLLFKASRRLEAGGSASNHPL